MYIHDVEPALDLVTFHYVVPHAASELADASPFQLISPGVIESSRAFEQISVLPRDASELLQDTEHLIAGRIAGRGHSVLPLPLNLLDEALGLLKDRIVVIVSATDEIASEVEPILRTSGVLALHVTPSGPKFSRATLCAHCLEVGRKWSQTQELKAYGRVVLRDLIDWKDPIQQRQLGFMDRGHLLTSPNMMVLKSVGYVGQPWDTQPLVGADNAPYFEALQQSIAPIVERRREILANYPSLEARTRTDLILTVPGVMKTWSSIGCDNLPSTLKPSEQKLIRKMMRQIVARDTYSFSCKVSDGTTLNEIVGHPFVLGMLEAHRQDLGVYTSVLGIRAASSFSPVVRLPPGANGAMLEWCQLAASSRAKAGVQHKLNRLAQALSTRLVKGVPEWIKDLLRKARRIKIVSDAPLEWMDLDGFPLMLRADVSRIPVTPGNLFVQQMLKASEVQVPAEAFQRVLVVRSFKSGDPVAPFLEKAVREFGKDGKQYPDVRIVDVRTRGQLVKAINEFDGAILVYDGHGAHSKASDIGTLELANEQVNPWTLKREVRMPPIVLLSACDTHPFDASHATVGNGFLAAGAMTVLATSVPVDGVESAVMIARLLYRVGAYLPLLIKHRPWHSFRWSEIVPGLQRRNYASDAVRRLTKFGALKISDSTAEEMLIDVGMAIDTGEDWLQMLIDRAGVAGNRSPTEIKNELRKHVSFAESLLYTQLGNPELVVGVGHYSKTVERSDADTRSS